MLVGLILLALVVYLVFTYVIPKRPKNFPPGPQSYPIIGDGPILAKLGKTGGESFTKLGELYGPVSGIRLGNRLGVVINGYEASKALYANDAFAHRPEIFIASYQWGGRMLGVFFSNGRLWQEQKRFTLRHLRDFGFGKSSMEGLIHEECEELIDSFKNEIKKAGSRSVITVHNRFGVSLINILWAIMAGVRHRHDDEDFKQMLKIIQDSFRVGSVRGNFVNAYPFLRHLPNFKEEFQKLAEGNIAVCKMVQDTIDDHVKTREPSDPPRDLIDVYLDAIEEHKNEHDSTFFRDQLVQICSDLFRAGSESTSNTIAFAVLHMLRNPDCQERVQKELDSVVGRDRFPSYDDRQNLPHTYAVMMESLRISPIAPVSVPHTCIEDTTFMGYTIPKGAVCRVNFMSTNMDKKYWGDPENFRPERFLNQDGSFDKSKLDHVFIFGFGKRQCLGESLARLSIFVIFSAVMQRFKFELIPGQPKPTIEPIDGLTVAPHPFSAKVSLRS